MSSRDILLVMQIEIQPTPKNQRTEELAYTYFNPKLPQLSEVLQCLLPHRQKSQDHALTLIERIQTPRKVWEQLAARDFIPHNWIDAPHRWFRWHQKHLDPKSTTQAIILAANVPQTLTMEALGWEMASRLQPFGLPTPKRIFWKFSNRPDTEATPPLHEPWLGFYQLLLESRLRSTQCRDQELEIERCTQEHLRALKTFATKNPAMRDMFFLAHLEDLWSIATRYDWRISNSPALFLDGTRFLPEALVGRSFQELSSPFSPLLAIWRLGFGCAGFMRSCLVLLSV
jgi:hypothetical protein